MEVDSDYEFNAPKYIDFLSNEPENEHLDSWFDENPDGHEGGISFSQACHLEHHSNYDEVTKKITAALEGKCDEEEKKMEVISEPQEEIKNPNEGENGDGTSESKPAVSEMTPSAPKKEELHALRSMNVEAQEKQKPKVENEEPKTEIKEKRITRSNSLKQEGRNAAVPNMKKRKSCTPNRLSTNKKSKNSDNQNDDVCMAKKPKVDVKKPLITMPNTPSFLRRLKNKLGPNKRTSEAIEIERIKKLQQETKKRLKDNETFIHKALAPQPVHQPRVGTELTKTVEFHFATDSRLKPHPMTTRSDDVMDGHKFVDQLRKHPPSPTFKNKKATKPVPFKFSSSSNSSKQEPAQTGTWKSVASAVIDFQTKTPDRWRSRPTSQQNIGPHLDEKAKGKMQLTHPKTPQLMTKRRSRPNGAPGQADLEEKIVEEMKGYKFKAREFNHKIVESGGHFGMGPLHRLPLTETKPFKFESDSRLEVRKKQVESKEEEGNEKSNKGRHEKTCDARDASAAHASRKRSHPKKTELKPFSFETRDKAMLQKKQDKIKKIFEEEEKAREFHARPLPNLSPDPVIVKPGRHVEQAPFNLATDERGAVRVEKWTSQMKRELEEEKEKTKFKAQPCTVVHKEAFVPKPSSKPLVEISQFKLNTEERSKKREDFEITKKEQQRTKEDDMQQILKDKQEEEEKEVLLLRKQMVHIAQPVRNLGEIEIKPSEKPLTLPETPKFETNKRFGSKVVRL